MRNLKVKIVLLLFVAILLSCEKNEQEESFVYLSKYEMIKYYEAGEAKNNLLVLKYIYPDIDALIPVSPFDVEVYRIEYRTKIQGKEVIASGIVSLPNENMLFPIVSFQNGTNTCNQNAPSESINEGLFPVFTSLAGNGYIIAIPDYIGFGSTDSIIHPYLHKQSSNNAIIDMILAVEEMVSKGNVDAGYSDNLYLMGYSQGGWASMSALHELETNAYGTGRLVAVAAGAGAYDLMGVAQFIMGSEIYISSYFFPYFIESRRQNGILDGAPALFYKEPYATRIPDLFDGTYCGSELSTQLNDTISRLFSDRLLSGLVNDADFKDLKNELTINSVLPWNTKVPVRLFHSKGDKTVPYEQSQNLYDGFIENYPESNKYVNLNVIEGNIDHNEAIMEWGIDAFKWFQEMK